MTVQTAPRPTPTTVTTHELTHIFCTHHPIMSTALCGTPRTKPVAAFRVIGKRHIVTHDMCVVCMEMVNKPCTQCGG